MVTLEHVCQHATTYVTIRLCITQAPTLKIVAFLPDIPVTAERTKQIIHLYFGTTPYIKIKIQIDIISISLFKIRLQACTCNPWLGIRQAFGRRIAINLISSDKTVVTSIGLFCTGCKNKPQAVVKETIARQDISLDIANTIDLRVITGLSGYIQFKPLGSIFHDKIYRATQSVSILVGRIGFQHLSSTNNLGGNHIQIRTAVTGTGGGRIHAIDSD